MKHHLVGGVGEKSRPARHRRQDATFPFDAQVQVQVGKLRNPAHQGFGLMGIEVVTDEMKAHCSRVSGNHPVEVGQEISFGTRGTTGGGDHFARDDIAAQDKGARAMPDLFKLPALDLAWGKR